MPKLSPDKLPKYRKHHVSGQAVVTLDGKDFYLGPHGTKASRTEYDRLVGEWQAHGRRLPASNGTPADLTINELMLAYVGFVEDYYRRADGTHTTEVANIHYAMRPLKALYGHTCVVEFGPLALQAVMARMIELDWTRRHINKSGQRIKRMFKWGTARELIPASVYHGLQAVEGLRRGRSKAREAEPVKPVPEAFVEAVLPHVSRQVAAMIQLQELTGMRPGEVVIMRTCDLETSGKLWTYTPERHKTEHHGHARIIYLGPQAQAVLKPWLRTELDAYLFSPAEAEAVRNAERHEIRKTPMTPSQAKRQPKKHPKRPKQERYTVDSYRRAIARACDIAFPLPEHLRQRRLPDGKNETRSAWRARLTPTEKAEIREWRRQHSWHPHQLRHNAATRLRRQFGIEAARVVLGHRSAAITEVYAEIDEAKAADIMLRVG